MTRSLTGCAVLTLFLCLAASRPSGGRSADDFKIAAGYTSLFNGKDLTGWRYPGVKGRDMDGKTETPDRRMAVENGVIVMREKDESGKNGIRDLYTNKTYNGNFHLKVDFRAGLKADSGVYLRGKQLQIRDFIRRGEEKQLTKFKNDDWNELDITVTGTEAVCRVNGQALKTMPVPARGRIGLQAETGKFEFRRVRVKDLD